MSRTVDVISEDLTFGEFSSYGSVSGKSQYRPNIVDLEGVVTEKTKTSAMR